MRATQEAGGLRLDQAFGHISTRRKQLQAAAVTPLATLLAAACGQEAKAQQPKLPDGWIWYSPPENFKRSYQIPLPPSYTVINGDSYDTYARLENPNNPTITDKYNPTQVIVAQLPTPASSMKLEDVAKLEVRSTTGVANLTQPSLVKVGLRQTDGYRFMYQKSIITDRNDVRQTQVTLVMDNGKLWRISYEGSTQNISRHQEEVTAMIDGFGAGDLSKVAKPRIVVKPQETTLQAANTPQAKDELTQPKQEFRYEGKDHPGYTMQLPGGFRKSTKLPYDLYLERDDDPKHKTTIAVRVDKTDQDVGAAVRKGASENKRKEGLSAMVYAIKGADAPPGVGFFDFYQSVETEVEVLYFVSKGFLTTIRLESTPVNRKQSSGLFDNFLQSYTPL